MSRARRFIQEVQSSMFGSNEPEQTDMFGKVSSTQQNNVVKKLAVMVQKANKMMQGTSRKDYEVKEYIADIRRQAEYIKSNLILKEVDKLEQAFKKRYSKKAPKGQIGMFGEGVNLKGVLIQDSKDKPERVMFTFKGQQKGGFIKNPDNGDVIVKVDGGKKQDFKMSHIGRVSKNKRDQYVVNVSYRMAGFLGLLK